jgi:glyoxylase-like metal-dependent hydrolase (beta-lactamase superfamily II)
VSERAPLALPAGVQVFERGWLSSNNILLCDDEGSTLVDSGYATHAAQTLALVERALQGRALDQLVNTHLHSDHCGGNAALQAHYPALDTRIPPGLAEPVQAWRDADLSYHPTGQTCPPFATTGLLTPGSTHRWADSEWQVHAAPGHDPHSVILFNPEHRLLISADALWENGFGVVFPELEGIAGFDDVAASLDWIEQLNPHTIIPGHGAVFGDVAGALQRARTRLEAFARAPDKHARYGAKVLLKFKLQEFGSIQRAEFMRWASEVPYLQALHQTYGGGNPQREWLEQMLADLARSGALIDDGETIKDVAG